MEQLSSEQVGQMNLNLPHDVVTLPSQGFFYKNKKKSVKVGYLTAADENFLANYASGRGNQDNFIISLLRSKIYENDIRPDELLEGDIQAILIFLRNTSFGPEYNVSIVDPDTEKSFTTTILLDELNIKNTIVKPDQEGLFTTTLPRLGSSVKLKLLSYGETMEIEKMAEQYPVGRVAPIVTWKLNKQIVEVNGNRDRETIAKFIETLPILDSKHIKNFLRENEPKLDLTREIMTPSGKKVTTSIAFGVEFFRVFF